MSYFGSKAAPGLCQTIIAMMPPHNTYIETHLGGGAIMKRKPPALKNLGIDRDPQAIREFGCEYPVELITGCAHSFIANYDFKGYELLYCDPPYLISTRTSPRRYRYDYTEGDHVELLNLLKSVPCQVMLSGYPSKLYDDALGDWNNVQVQAISRGGIRTEKVWFNFEIDRVHWASYTGKNFTERQNVKHKAARWAKNYKAMPNDQRLAILAAIMAVEADEVD